MLRIAVVGSGPAGVYAAEALLRHGDVNVDVLDRLPAPYGLVRYGVAPDHVKIRSISTALAAILEDPAVRFLGNVDVGVDLTLEDLQRHYDAVVLAGGAAVDRRLGIPGEDLPGSYSATDFVAWYNGHPDAPLDAFVLNARRVAVLGVGNVAVDVVRLLAKTTDELRDTDMPDHVLEVLAASAVEDITMIGRRGPAQAKFTTKELRELGELADADVVVDPGDLELDEASAQLVAEKPAVRRNVEVLREWAVRTPAGRSRRIHVRFWLQPVEILGVEQVSGVVVEKTALDAAGSAVGSGQTSTVDADMVFRSVGYRGVPMLGLPFDERSGVISNAEGRVIRDGVPVPGVYVAGWIKRGPTGVIGTNKHDARQTVAALLADAPSLPPAPVRDPGAVLRLLLERGVQPVDWSGWRAIDLAEAELGRQQGRERGRISDRQALLRAAASQR